MKKVSFVLLSGGTGTRMKMNIPKQFLLLGGKPMIVHVLEKIEKIEQISEVIIPSPKDFITKTEEIISRYQFVKPMKVVEGGASRQESTYKGLLFVNNECVIVHEAVRPFVSREEFQRLIDCSEKNATYGADIPFTVLEGNDYIEKNLDRSRLINIQLPQKFDAAKLRLAHERAIADGKFFTEDASLYFHYQNEKIKILAGTDYNLKITKPIDRKIAEIIYKHYVLGEA